MTIGNLAIDLMRSERDEARAHARVLAHAYEHDSSPPSSVVAAALAYPVGPSGGGIAIRSSLAWFVIRMEQKLRENDHKGGWVDCTMRYLLVRMKNERTELAAAVRRAKRHAGVGYWRRDDAEGVIREAADVSNFAYMVADVAKKSTREDVDA
jgi:hypothetical protein